MQAQSSVDVFPIKVVKKYKCIKCYYRLFEDEYKSFLTRNQVQVLDASDLPTEGKEIVLTDFFVDPAFEFLSKNRLIYKAHCSNCKKYFANQDCFGLCYRCVVSKGLVKDLPNEWQESIEKLRRNKLLKLYKNKNSNIKRTETSQSNIDVECDYELELLECKIFKKAERKGHLPVDYE